MRHADIGTAAELALALDVLHGHHDREVLEQLGSHLPEILEGPPGLTAVLSALKPPDQIYLIQTLGPRLTDLVGNATVLSQILARMADVAVEQRLLEVIGRDGLRLLIQSPRDLAAALEWVYGQCDSTLLDLLGTDYVAGLLESGFDLSLLLRRLDPQRQRELVAHMGWERLVGLIRGRRDLGYLLRALPVDAGRLLLEHLPRERVAALITTRRHWQEVTRMLQADEIASLRERLGEGFHAA